MCNNDFFVYILECKDKSYYVGHTDNIEKRLAEHGAGINNYTSKRLPINLIYVERFQTRDDAFLAEHRIKKWSRAKKEALMQKKFDVLHELSKCRSEK